MPRNAAQLVLKIYQAARECADGPWRHRAEATTGRLPEYLIDAAIMESAYFGIVSVARRVARQARRAATSSALRDEMHEEMIDLLAELHFGSPEKETHPSDHRAEVKEIYAEFKDDRMKAYDKCDDDEMLLMLEEFLLDDFTSQGIEIKEQFINDYARNISTGVDAVPVAS